MQVQLELKGTGAIGDAVRDGDGGTADGVQVRKGGARALESVLVKARAQDECDKYGLDFFGRRELLCRVQMKLDALAAETASAQEM
eukprot:6826085-Pyramimonas_sp.AAC.1